MVGSIGRVGQMIGRVGRSDAGRRFDSASLAYDLWDPRRADTLTLSGAAVTEFRSVTHGYALAQAVVGSRPTRLAGGLLGRDCLSVDGVDDFLAMTGIGVFPGSSDPCELIALVEQSALPADTSARYVGGYGGSTAPTGRGLRRGVTGGVNQATALWGVSGGSNVIASAPGDFSGVHVVRVRITATAGVVWMDGAAGSAVAGPPTTGNAQFRLGCTGAGAAPANYFQGKIGPFGVFPLLSDADYARVAADFTS